MLRAGVLRAAPPAVPRHPLHGRRVQRQPARAGREHHHCQPVLRRERHLPEGFELSAIPREFLLTLNPKAQSRPKGF